MKTLVTAAQLARALNLTASRITGMKADGCPYVRIDGKSDRFDLAAATRWYFDNVAKERKPMTDAEVDAEMLTRMEAVVRTAVTEHLVAMQSDRYVTRLSGLLTRCGLQPKVVYLAVQSVRLWIGASLGNEACVVINTPVSRSEIAWQREFVRIARAAISGKA